MDYTYHDRENAARIVNTLDHIVPHYLSPHNGESSVRIALIQLSDIHFRQNKNLILDRTEAIAAAIWSNVLETDRQYFLITGDVAFSGNSTEYEIAGRFFNEISNAGQKYLPKPSWRFFIIPGNHDCDFSGDQSVREIVLKTSTVELSQTNSESGVVLSLLQVQQNFFTFLDNFLGSTQAKSTRTLWTHGEALGKHNVAFICLNSSIASKLSEKQGDLFLLQADIEILETFPSNDLIILLSHHPSNWLNANNAIRANRAIDSVADLIFTGHQHVDASYTKDLLDGNTSSYFEADVLQGDADESSGFKIVLVDLEGQLFASTPFAWSGDRYLPGNTASGTLKRIHKTNSLSFTKEHEAFLSDPGAGFTHPRKEVLTLSDLYVAPDLTARQIQPLSSKVVDYERIPSAKALAFLTSKSHCLVIGDEQSGKSALAKILVVLFRSQGRMPVLITGDVLRSRVIEDPKRLLSAAISAQYGASSQEPYWQLERSQRCIVIDDFQRCGLNRQGQASILSALSEVAGSLFIFADTLYRFEELHREDSSSYVFSDFDYAEIKEFGYRLRANLIERWHSLGRERLLSDNDLAHEARRSERLVEALLGKNLLPSFPFAVLTLLQLAEAGRESSRNAGSYGSMYESLLSSALALNSTPTDINVNYAFLSAVAHRMFSLDRGYLSQTEMEDLGREYEERVEMRLHLDQRLTSLGQRKILKQRQSRWEFQYSYIYYYFVARWFRDAALANPAIREQLLEMADAVASERNTNVLVFYLSLSQDLAVVERVLDNAKGIYLTHGPFNFSSDVEFLDNLFKGQLLIKEPDITKEDRERHKDSLDDEGADTQSEKHEGEIEEIVELNIAFKTLQILGQFVRNFPGSLEASIKRRIVEECYMLGLRSLSAVFNVAEQSIDELRNYFMALIRDRRALLSDAEARRAGDESVLWLTRACAFGIVKRISNAVGLEELEQTYSSVLKSNRTTSTRLLDISIKLDHFTLPPETEVQELGKDIRRSLFTTVVLQDLVHQHLLTFPVEQKQRQRLLSWLDVKGPTPKLFDNPQRKRRTRRDPPGMPSK